MKHSRVVLDPIKHVLRVFWTASKTFLEKHVSWESEQRFKLWGKDISIQEKQAMLISILYIKNINEECFIGYKAHAHDVLSLFW